MTSVDMVAAQTDAQQTGTVQTRKRLNRTVCKPTAIVCEQSTREQRSIIHDCITVQLLYRKVEQPKLGFDRFSMEHC